MCRLRDKHGSNSGKQRQSTAPPNQQSQPQPQPQQWHSEQLEPLVAPGLLPSPKVPPGKQPGAGQPLEQLPVVSQVLTHASQASPNSRHQAPSQRQASLTPAKLQAIPKRQTLASRFLKAQKSSHAIVVPPVQQQHELPSRSNSLPDAACLFPERGMSRLPSTNWRQRMRLAMGISRSTSKPASPASAMALADRPWRARGTSEQGGSGISRSGTHPVSHMRSLEQSLISTAT